MIEYFYQEQDDRQQLEERYAYNIDSKLADLKERAFAVYNGMSEDNDTNLFSDNKHLITYIFETIEAISQAMSDVEFYMHYEVKTHKHSEDVLKDLHWVMDETKGFERIFSTISDNIKNYVLYSKYYNRTRDHFDCYNSITDACQNGIFSAKAVYFEIRDMFDLVNKILFGDN